ncbi:hypothetical protein KY285_037215 [Solanum tuberosum]|nr:hypothetical protein KY289_037428 [Solanum tuberosum]KAH0640629.1 hypothetical protein KY285_037215 [Solanum tuberosum]
MDLLHLSIAGDKGLFSLAPPHQRIDGEWSDGVVVLSMMKMLHLAGKDGISHTMMVSPYSSTVKPR